MDKSDYQQLVFLLPILLSIWVTITVGVYTIRRHRVIGARSFAAVLFCEAIWTTGYLFEFISTDLGMENLLGQCTMASNLCVTFIIFIICI